MAAFGYKLKLMLDYLEVSAHELAVGTGISKSVISSYLSDEKTASPSYDKIKTISKFVDISPQYFFSPIVPKLFFQMDAVRKIWIQFAQLDLAEQKVLLDVITSHVSLKKVKENAELDLNYQEK